MLRSETVMIEKLLLHNWTPGGVGVWVLVAITLIAWWKGLPPVLEAWSNSVARERADRTREIERLEGQIKAADDRHSECMEGQRKLRDEMSEMSRRHGEEVLRLQNLISGLMAQVRQMQFSALDAGQALPGLPPEFAALLVSLERNETLKGNDQ
jgi:hypothetical protein